MLRLSNSLSNHVEDFKPLEDGVVKMYHCGPTVYDFVHVGNLRSFYLGDLLRRYFEYENFKVTQVMNITDVGQLSSDSDDGEDKMTTGLRREGKPITLEAMKELADFYTEKFKEDIASLNILPAHFLPKASENIDEDIEIIKTLEEKGFAYKTSDGIYFDVNKDPHYGQLGGLTSAKNSEARIETNNEKRDQRDFALWKFNSEMGFPSPWGQGFPGWHIECSAMSRKYLGNSFDIHTGGIDLAPIHHNNEIAQSENACDCKFVNYWVHNEFVNMGEIKMAKSQGNFVTLRTLIEKGYAPLSYRYFLLQSHYKTPTTFSWESLDGAETSLRRLKETVATLQDGGKISKKYQKKFLKALDNDLNTPEALAVVWEIIKDEKLNPAIKKATVLDLDKILGLNLSHNEFDIVDIPLNVKSLLHRREEARKSEDWKKADLLRDEIEKMGYKIKDTEEGQKLSKI